MTSSRELRAGVVLELQASVLAQWRDTAAWNESIRALIRRRVMTVLREIDKLPDTATREAERSWDTVIVKRVLPEANLAIEARASSPLAVEWVRGVVRQYVQDLEARHEPLNERALALGARMSELPASTLGLELPKAVPVVVEGDYAPAAAYSRLLERWTDHAASTIKGIVDDARRGDIGLSEGMARLREGLGVERSDAARLMRTGVGVAHTEASHQRLEEIAEVFDGVAKVWHSALATTTRRWHRRAHGQKRPVSEDFEIQDPKEGIVLMMHPLDPRGGPAQTANCLCCELSDVSEIRVAASWTKAGLRLVA